MNNWIQIISFTYPHEAHLAKGRLESEGIEIRLKDELTVQVNNFYSNAIGGVKLLVKELDYERAYQILVESGYIKEHEKSPLRFLLWFDRFSSKFPFIGKSRIELRLILFIAVLLALIIFPIVLSSLPTLEERLTVKSWCIDKIIYKGKELKPNTSEDEIFFDPWFCEEEIWFRKNGIVHLPGFNSSGITGIWKLQNRRLEILPDYRFEDYNKEDTVDSIFIGVYKLRIRSNKIILKSNEIIITGYLESNLIPM